MLFGDKYFLGNLLRLRSIYTHREWNIGLTLLLLRSVMLLAGHGHARGHGHERPQLFDFQIRGVACDMQKTPELCTNLSHGTVSLL